MLRCSAGGQQLLQLSGCWRPWHCVRTRGGNLGSELYLCSLAAHQGCVGDCPGVAHADGSFRSGPPRAADAEGS